MGLIESLEVFACRFELKDPFVIAPSSTTEYNGVIIKIKDSEGDIGVGEASPSKRVTGESVSRVKHILSGAINDLIIGRDIVSEFAILVNELHDKLTYSYPSALCAINTALYDLYSRKLGISVGKLTGLMRPRIATSITLSIGDVKETLQYAQRAVETYGARELKVKIGQDPDRDISVIKALYEAFGNDIGIRADANTGYNVSRAIKVLKAIERYEVEFVEEPLAVGDIEGLIEVKRHTELPIMADESIKTPKDAIGLVKLGVYDMFNIKLMKCGGITGALSIATIAKAADIKCQIGCMIETPIGITAGVIVALSSRTIEYADLDGYTFMRPRDLRCFSGGAKIKDGYIYLEDASSKGLGISIDYSRLISSSSSSSTS